VTEINKYGQKAAPSTLVLLLSHKKWWICWDG